MFTRATCSVLIILALYSPRSTSSGGCVAPTAADAGGDALAVSIRWWRGSGGSGGSGAPSYNPFLRLYLNNNQPTRGILQLTLNNMPLLRYCDTF